jgi:hypothetical protein
LNVSSQVGYSVVGGRVESLAAGYSSIEESLPSFSMVVRRAEIEALHTFDKLGAHSIPKFIIEGKLSWDGNAHATTFVEIFQRD